MHHYRIILQENNRNGKQTIIADRVTALALSGVVQDFLLDNGITQFQTTWSIDGGIVTPKGCTEADTPWLIKILERGRA